jgi:hypothetical protein
LYEEDNLTLKIYFSDRESPYASDGIKGKVENLCEVFLTVTPTPSQAEVHFLNEGGSMNYQSVTQSFYLSLPIARQTQEKLKVAISIDGKDIEVEANNVLYDGVIDARTALKCVTEYDQNRFLSLTSNGTFNGEIYIRLLYDNGCYYYVGVCDKQGNTCAYLVDGESGRIITTKK